MQCLQVVTVSSLALSLRRVAGILNFLVVLTFLITVLGAPVVLVRILLIGFLVYDDLLVLLILSCHTVLSHLLLLESEDLLGLLLSQVCLAEIDHLLKALRSDAPSDKSGVESLPGANVIFGPETIG